MSLFSRMKRAKYISTSTGIVDLTELGRIFLQVKTKLDEDGKWTFLKLLQEKYNEILGRRKIRQGYFPTLKPHRQGSITHLFRLLTGKCYNRHFSGTYRCQRTGDVCMSNLHCVFGFTYILEHQRSFNW